MPLRLYRVCRAKHARLDGYGAKLVGGRWNSPGRAVVYMTESVSLAILENLVHMAREDFPTGYVVVSATVPELVSVCTEAQLRSIEYLHLYPGVTLPLLSATSQQLGDYWLESGMSAVLKVASSVVPTEHNFLLNPEHSDFGRIEVDEAILFRFDSRLFGLTS